MYASLNRAYSRKLGQHPILVKNIFFWKKKKKKKKKAPKFPPSPIQSLFKGFCIKIKLWIIFTKGGSIQLLDTWNVYGVIFSPRANIIELYYYIRVVNLYTFPNWFGQLRGNYLFIWGGGFKFVFFLYIYDIIYKGK